MSERAALDLICSISDRFTKLCLYMTIACEWRLVKGPEPHEECLHNQRTAIWQTFSMQYSPKFAQQACLQTSARRLVGSRDPGPALVAGVQVTGRQVTSYQSSPFTCGVRYC
jgi:hypothetical protein